MGRDAMTGRSGPGTVGGVVDILFGRWPAWPWSVLIVIAAGGLVGAAAAPLVLDSGLLRASASGRFACAAYGLVATALLTLLPRVWRLMTLQPGVSRRPESPGGTWWPLELLAAALRVTPLHRRTIEEFNAAVAMAFGQARTILADRLWPVWVAAFVAPVLGLLAAWTSGSQVLAGIRESATAAEALRAFVVVVSPPMVATIAAALALIVAVVVVDQWTKRLLLRWQGVVQAADGDHPLVRERLNLGDTVVVAVEGSGTDNDSHDDQSGPRTKHRHHPDHLEQIWRQSPPTGGGS